MIVWDKKAAWPDEYQSIVANIEEVVRSVYRGNIKQVQCGDILVYPTAGGVTLSKAATIALLERPKPRLGPKKELAETA